MFASKDTLLTRPSGYTIARSVRLRSSASAYLNRTPASATNRKTYTFSAWIKNGGTEGRVFGADTSNAGTNTAILSFGSNGQVASVQLYISGTYNLYWQSTAVYRDPSAWYHVVFVVDTTQASSANAVKIYVNGLQITLTFTAFTGSYTQNMDTAINNNVSHLIGIMNAFSQYFDGYLTEINFIDGQALTPSSFGETDSITGVWKAKKYGGTYGTNGFYLNFSDNSSNTATTIGKDYSGNGNNWTPNNISVTSGSTYDSMVDSPTVSAVSSNYAVLNPVSTVGSPTLSAGNLNATGSASQSSFSGTIGANSGKYYAEFTPTSIGGAVHFGVFALGGNSNGGNVGSGQDSRCIYRNDGAVFTSSQVATYATYTTSNTIGVALNLDASPPTAAFYKDNSLQGTVNLSTSFSNWTFAVLTNGSSDAGVTNFGQRPFTYTPPTGYVALNTWNLPDSTIKNGAAYMAATTYTGTGSTQSITNTVGSTSFQPDFVWIKSRSNAENHNIVDSIRGAGVWLASNLTQAETNDTGSYGVSTFNSNGFTVISNGTRTNASGYTYVGWQWKAGGTSSSNTNGSITSTVSVGATQGFSVVTYTGTGANATVGHGLGVAPSMIIVKDRSVSNWNVYHTSLGNTQAVLLNSTNATSTSAGYWNNTSPTSTVFSVGNGTSFTSGLAYCFAAVAGYSAFGSYTGNGSTDGPFVFTGFRPRWLMTKRTDSSVSGDWNLVDTSRGTYNAVGPYLYANQSAAEGNAAIYDILSNGFKIRETGSGTNANGGTYIYACFAENPFKNALAR